MRSGSGDHANDPVEVVGRTLFLLWAGGEFTQLSAEEAEQAKADHVRTHTEEARVNADTNSDHR